MQTPSGPGRGSSQSGASTDDDHSPSTQAESTITTPTIQPTTGVDELIVPSLVQRAFATQSIETLGYFIDATVPGLYYTYSDRVTTNWLDFTRQRTDPAYECLIWAVRCLGFLHIGYNNKDQDMIAHSRLMYGQSLRGLSRLLQDPRKVRSDVTCAIGVMLGVFEMLDGNTQQSWLSHSTGISTLIRLRGPDAHRSGFGRTILVSFRSYIVFDGLIRGESCFLAEPAWRQMLWETVMEEKSSGKGCRLSELAELAFIEVAECPGLYARMRNMVKHGDSDPAVRANLLSEVIRCRNRLQLLKDQLELDFPSWLSDEELKIRRDLVAWIPIPLARKVRNMAVRGARAALALLDQISVLVNSHSHQLTMDPTGSVSQAWTTIIPPAIAPSVISGREDLLPNGLPAWPDDLALSMGMLGVKDD